ncbi:MAG: porin [Roseinatronobacter sp.]
MPLTLLRSCALCLLATLAPPALAQGLDATVSGDARMGLVWDRGPDWAGQRETGLRLTNRARLKFQLTGETDGGLNYGATLRLDPNRARPPRPSVFVGQGN